MIAPHKRLTVWQKAFELAKEIYVLTENFPKKEQFNITQQIRRLPAYLFIICVYLSACPLTCLSADFLKTPGVAGAPFLKIGVSARPASMANSFVGLSDDISSIEYNPAGISEIKNFELGLTHVLWFEDITLNNLLFGKKISENSGIGMSYQLLQAKDYEREIKIISEELSEIKTGDEIKLNDSAISVGWAQKLDVGSDYQNQLSLGVLLKYISEELYKKGNSAFAGDFGIIYRTPGTHKSYGLSIQNLGTEIGKDILPACVRGGVTHQGEGFNFSVDVIQYIDSKIKASVGLEILFSNVFALRGGVFYQEKFNFTAGAGFNIKPVSIDYAYLPHNELGQAQRVSFLVRFGSAQISQEQDVVKKPVEKSEPIEKPVTVPAGEKINLAVADFAGKNVSAADASIVADFLRTELVNTQMFNVMDRANMETILSEQKFQLSGCTTEECAVKMGKLLNVQQIVVGSLSKLLDTYYITVNLVDVETGKILKSFDHEVVSSKEFRNACKILALEISH